MHSFGPAEVAIRLIQDPAIAVHKAYGDNQVIQGLIDLMILTYEYMAH